MRQVAVENPITIFNLSTKFCKREFTVDGKPFAITFTLDQLPSNTTFWHVSFCFTNHELMSDELIQTVKEAFLDKNAIEIPSVWGKGVRQFMLPIK